MRIAEIVTAVILGIFSIYLMWKSGEPPSWNPDIPRFANIGMIEGEGPGSGFWPFWLSLIMLGCCVCRRRTVRLSGDDPYCWFLRCNRAFHGLLHAFLGTPLLDAITHRRR